MTILRFVEYVDNTNATYNANVTEKFLNKNNNNDFVIVIVVVNSSNKNGDIIISVK